eukprot:s1255_g20.t3
MPATDLADLADLAQLQKLRQECLKLREYNEALNKIIVIKRLEQEKTCLQRARRNRRDALHRRLLLGEAALTIRCLRGMLLAWRRRTQRCRFMLLAFKQESDVFLRARHEEDAEHQLLLELKQPSLLPEYVFSEMSISWTPKLPEDVRLMAQLEVKAYRFSISWSRILPGGEVNQEGINFYSELIDSLLEAGIEPWVTLYHWDLPEALHSKGHNMLLAHAEAVRIYREELESVKFRPGRAGQEVGRAKQSISGMNKENTKKFDWLLPRQNNLDATFDDSERVRFFRAHLSAVHAAVERGAKVWGYFAWSFLDNFEWAEGYEKRFGIVRVNFMTQERTIKSSGRFLASVFKASFVLGVHRCRQMPCSWLRKWRVVLLEKKVLLSTDFCREKKLLAEGMQQKLSEAQERLKKARSQRSAQRLEILALAHGQTLSGTSWQIFTRWAYYVSCAHSHRREVKLLLFPNNSCLLQDIFNAWLAILRCNTRKPKLTLRIVDCRSEQVARSTTSRLSMLFDAWRHVAAFNEKTQAAATFQKVFPTRTASFCIQHQKRVQLADSLWTWRNFAKREAQEEEHASVCRTCENQEAMASRRQLADLRGTSICQDAWKWNLLRTSLSSWIWSSVSSRLQERRESLQEVQRLSLGLAAAEGQERSVKMALGALACASSLRRLLCRRQHIAFKHWRSRQASHGVFGELEAAKSSAALLSLNRQCLEDLFVEQHHTVLRARQAAQEVASAWMLYSKQSLFRRTVVAWRVGSLASRSERKRQWQDMRRKAEDDNFALLDKEEAIQAKAAEVLLCSSAQQFLSLIVKRWRRLAFKEKRSREVELLRQRSQARLQEQQRRLEQAQLATVRYRNHAFASCFVTSAVGSANWKKCSLQL